MRNHRIGISATHTLSLMVTLYLREKHAHYCSIFWSCRRILPAGILRQIWPLFNDPMGHYLTNYFWACLLYLLEFRIFSGYQVYLWNRDRCLLTSVSILYNINLTFLYAGWIACEVASILVRWMSFHLFCELDSLATIQLEDPTVCDLPARSVCIDLIQNIWQIESEVSVGAKKRRWSLLISELYVRAQLTLDCKKRISSCSHVRRYRIEVDVGYSY